MAKKTKAPNDKDILKNEIHELLKATFEQLEIEIDTDHEKYGLTKGTIIVKGEKCDLQIKLMSPNSNLIRYKPLEEEKEEEEKEEEEKEEEEQ